MSLKSAMEALNAAPTAIETPTAPPSMPQNMANGGANIIENAQASQESKENGTNGSQQSATPGVVEATAPPAEAAPTSPPAKIEEPPKKAEEPLSSKFAALAKKEKGLVKLQSDIKTKEAGFAAREAEITAREAKMQQSEALWETDIWAALQSKGYTYQKLTDMILTGKGAPEKAPVDPIAEAQKIADSLRKEIADKEKSREQEALKAKEKAEADQKTALENAYASYRTEIGTFTKENEAEYELINMYGQQELVVDTVQEYYEKHQRVLSVKEASDMVEKYLASEAEKAFNARKFATRLAPKAEPKNTLKEAAPKAPAQTKTLSNSLAPTMSAPLPSATDAERMKRALEKLNNPR